MSIIPEEFPEELDGGSESLDRPDNTSRFGDMTREQLVRYLMRTLDRLHDTNERIRTLKDINDRLNSQLSSLQSENNRLTQRVNELEEESTKELKINDEQILKPVFYIYMLGGLAASVAISSPTLGAVHFIGFLILIVHDFLEG